MSFPPAFSRFKRQISHQNSQLRRVFRRLSPAAAKIAGLGLPFVASSAAFAQTAAKTSEATVTWGQSIILGLVQGLTEFIPISSSGHLNIVHALMHHPRQLDFDIFLSIGTTVALAWYFRHDWKALLTDKTQSKLRNLVFLSCVPAVLVGLKLRHLEDNPPFSDARFNAICMIVAGLVLLWADKVGKRERPIGTVSVKDSLLIGLSQAAALVPGISRSGATLTAGLFLGLKREDAARFSFLMSLPISTGVILYSLLSLMKPGAAPIAASPLAVILGVVFSAISGFWAISFLLNYLKTRDVTPFVIWRVVFGLATFFYFSSRSR